MKVESLNGFIKGKHYNICKRLHMLYAAVLEILRIEELVNEETDTLVSIQACKDEIKDMNEKPFSVEDISGNLKDVLESLQSNRADTSAGEFGCTAQYWSGYTNMVKNWFELSRSIREGDFDLYIYTLKKISIYFFVFNQPNYARGLTEYHSKLMNITTTHPDVEKQFRSGAFGVRRSKRSFSSMERKRFTY